MSRPAPDLDLPLTLGLRHRVRFVADALDPADAALGELLDGDAPRAIAFVDAAVAEARPGLEGQLQRYLAARAPRVRLVGPLRRVPGGEAVKSEPGNLLPILQQISGAGIDRHSYVIAIGGGALLDVVGFAAAVAHRGVRLIRLPTTTLAQADSGVGVKNGVNAYGKKNYLGTFAAPWGVVMSRAFLDTLPLRQWRHGFAEAVKVAVVKDAAFFLEIEANSAALCNGDRAAGWPVIVRSATLHALHIATGGDPFELTTARPLDFGHWAAHRLETMTGGELPHGEAVAIGVALDTAYAARTGLLAPDAADRITRCLTALGLPVSHSALADADDLLAGLDEFREHLGGRLTVTLPRAIGDAVDVHAIDPAAMRACLAEAAAARAIH